MSRQDATRGADEPARPRALVTGGARRVGRAIALELARSGCVVDLTYHDSVADAERLVRDLDAAGSVGSRAWRLDLADLDCVRRFADEHAARCPTLRVLVHNASSYFATPIDTIEPGEAEALMRIHAVAPLLLTRGLLEPLRRDGRGSVVAMLDVHAMGQPRIGYSAYAMSKAALHELVRSLAVELAPEVRVNGVAPGIVQWPDDGPDSDPAMQARYLSRVPLARAGTPEEAAAGVVFLSLHASYTTGHVLRVDGGRSIR